MYVYLKMCIHKNLSRIGAQTKNLNTNAHEHHINLAIQSRYQNCQAFRGHSWSIPGDWTRQISATFNGVDEYQSNLRIWCIYIYTIYTKTYVSWTERISKIQQYSIVNTGIRYMHEGPWTSIKIASYEYWEVIVFFGGQSYLSFYGISPSQAMFSTSILNWSSPFCNTAYVFICIYTQIYENSLSQDSTHTNYLL